MKGIPTGGGAGGMKRLAFQSRSKGFGTAGVPTREMAAAGEPAMPTAGKRKRKRGGKVSGKKPVHRLDKRARGGHLDSGTHEFNVPSGGVSAHGRREAKKKGDTLPGTDKFPIRNLSDLEKAKHDIGRTTEPRSKVVAYIDREAKKLGGRPVGERKKK